MEKNTVRSPQRWQSKDYEGPVKYHVYYEDVLVHTFATDGDEAMVANVLENNGLQFDEIKCVITD